MSTKIEARVRAFVSELDGLIRQAALEAVREVLQGPARPRRAGRPARIAANGGRRAPATMDHQMSQILDHVRAHPGTKMETMAAALGGTSSLLHRPMGKLLAARKVRRVGERRGSRYYAGA